MLHAILAPRINNNDDQVRFSALLIACGDHVRAGQEIAEVETDKASFTVESEVDGYLLKVVPSVGDTVDVGGVLLWLGDSPDELVPDAPATDVKAGAVPQLAPTAKARLMIARFGLDAAGIPAAGERLTVSDVEAFLVRRETTAAAALGSAPSAVADSAPAEAGAFERMSPEERGMLRSVLWHRDVAAPAYLEISYDTGVWDGYAANYAQQNRLMVSPLISLMAYRLAAIARTHPKLNCVVVNDRRYRYAHVNLGFTIQAEDILYLVVVHEAEKMGAAEFIKSLTRLHKNVLAKKLTAADLTGATVGFSSMARWSASRHVPILPSHVSLMLAHSISRDGEGVLGATYDHRLLSGGDAIGILRALAAPPAEAEEPTT